MTVAAIVQARFGSSRLPGKVLELLGGRTALVRCLERVQRVSLADLVVCAVPEGENDDEIAEEAADAGVLVTRGPEDDVLTRYAIAAREAGADTVIRVTSDCPFIDPDIVDRTVALFFESGTDYACNNMPARFPHGLDCEVFHARHLFDAERKADTAHEREHVTPWIREREGFIKANLSGPGGGFERLRWTLDRAEDLAFARAVYAGMGSGAATASAAELAAFCLRRPDITAINAMWTDKARLEAPLHADIESDPVPLRAAA